MARLLGAAMLVVAASADGPCCKKCDLPLVKYYSVDLAHGFCGDACMDPKKFSIYKKFEANLTLVDDEHPECSGQYTPDGKFYTDYDSTVTHGDPFGILAVTLDLYAPTGMPDHSCCSTPLPFRINCRGKPKNMTIRGTGPYCCPASATEEEPCEKEVAIEEKKEVAIDEGTIKISATIVPNAIGSLDLRSGNPGTIIDALLIVPTIPTLALSTVKVGPPCHFINRYNKYICSETNDTQSCRMGWERPGNCNDAGYTVCCQLNNDKYYFKAGRKCSDGIVAPGSQPFKPCDTTAALLV